MPRIAHTRTERKGGQRELYHHRHNFTSSLREKQNNPVVSYIGLAFLAAAKAREPFAAAAASHRNKLDDKKKRGKRFSAGLSLKQF
jgi:hypothetical protein